MVASSNYNPEHVIVGILLDQNHSHHNEILDAVLDISGSMVDVRAALAIKTIASLFRSTGLVPAYFTVNEESKKVDPLLHRQAVNDDRSFSSFLMECLEYSDFRASYQYYISILFERIAKTKLAELRGKDFTTDTASEEIATIKDTIEGIETGLYSSDRKVMIEEYSKTISTILDSRGHEAAGLPIGFPSLDREIGGILPDDLMIIGARPTVGKTAFALCVADPLLKEGIPISFYSYDMSEQQFLLRLTSFYSLLSVTEIKTKEFYGDEAKAWKALSYAQQRLVDSPLYLTFSHLEMPALARSIRDDVRKRGVKMVFIDYLQIIPWSRYDDDYRRVSNVVRKLKTLAREAGVPIILLSQLARPDKRALDREPRNDELRSSGQIEQDASYIILLHRYPQVAGQPELGSDGVVILSKSQNGAQGRAHAKLGRGFRWEEKIINHEI
jgi:replicative DNA helicase